MCIKENIIIYSEITRQWNLFWNSSVTAEVPQNHHLSFCPLLLSCARNPRSVNRVQMCPAESVFTTALSLSNKPGGSDKLMHITLHKGLAMFSLCEAKTPSTRSFGGIQWVGR